MKWSLFLYYCSYCITHNIAAKSYDDFFNDRKLVALILQNYYSFILTNKQ